MAIFTKNNIFSSYDVGVYEGFVDPSLAGIQTLIKESAYDMYKINAALYISDIHIEESILEGADASVLLESVVKDTWAKIKTFFIKLWEKVKAWFKTARQYLDRLFLSGEKFVKKYKSQLESKAREATKFEFEGFDYTLDKGDAHVTSLIEQMKTAIIDELGALQHISGDERDILSGRSGTFKADKKNAIEDTFYEKHGGSSSKILEEAAKKFRNGEEIAKTQKIGNVNNMMDVVLKAKDSIKTVNEKQKLIDSEFSSIIKAIESAKSKFKSDTDAQLISMAKKKIESCKSLVTMSSSLAGVHVDAIKEANKTYTKALKKLLTFKIVSDSYNSYDEYEGSILENSMNYL